MLGLQYTRPSLLPLPGQPVHIPLVVMCHCRKEGDGECVKVEPIQDVVDKIGPFAVLVLVVGSATKKIVIVYICLSPAKNHFPTVSAVVNSPC